VSPDQVELFLSTGKAWGVRPADIVGALANEAGVAGADIGRLTIHQRKVFVGLSREVADRVLRDHPALTIRGADIRVQRARGRALPQG
jgi:ATP-dependent RNA helicase DeaD